MNILLQVVEVHRGELFGVPCALEELPLDENKGHVCLLNPAYMYSRKVYTSSEERCYNMGITNCLLLLPCKTTNSDRDRGEYTEVRYRTVRVVQLHVDAMNRVRIRTIFSLSNLRNSSAAYHRQDT